MKGWLIGAAVCVIWCPAIVGLLMLMQWDIENLYGAPPTQTLTTVAPALVEAAPGDHDIRLRLPEAGQATFYPGFLAVHPIPTDPETGDPLFSPRRWVKRWTRDLWLRESRRGKLKTRNAEPIPIDEGEVEEVAE